MSDPKIFKFPNEKGELVLSIDLDEEIFSMKIHREGSDRKPDRFIIRALMSDRGIPVKDAPQGNLLDSFFYTDENKTEFKISVVEKSEYPLIIDNMSGKILAFNCEELLAERIASKVTKEDINQASKTLTSEDMQDAIK